MKTQNARRRFVKEMVARQQLRKKRDLRAATAIRRKAQG